MHLDHFSKTVAERLFARFPNWRAYAHVERANDGNGFLCLEVPAASGAPDAPALHLWTANGEVCVGFAALLNRFNERTEHGGRTGADAAVDFVWDLLSEKLSVASWWVGDRWCAAACVESGQSPAAVGLPDGCDRIRIRSWTGMHNADIAT